MTDDRMDVRAFGTSRRLEAAARRRSDMWSTGIGTVVAGALGYWAFQTVAHAVLFAFLVFSVSVVGNRIVWELRERQLMEDERQLESSRQDPAAEGHE